MGGDADLVTHSPVVLRPDPGRTVLRPFAPSGPDGDGVRAARVIERVTALPPDELARQLARVTGSLARRHREVEAAMRGRYEALCDEGLAGGLPDDRARLVGAYFLQEYAFEAAALFNPSMARFHDQAGVPAGGVRFILALRGIGEGHVSSVTYRLGTWDPAHGFRVERPSGLAIAPLIERGRDGDDTIRIICEHSTHPSETVLFPVTAAQAQGIEDMRLVHFREEDGAVRYLGVFTAFDGRATRAELMEVDDFRTFTLRRLTGDAAAGKDLALFPRRVDGRYAMLARPDGENLWLLRSDRLTHWDTAGGARLLCPASAWEFVQVGTCGSPIELPEGWLVLTHGVGPVRNYCLGAALLDRDDPGRLLGRTTVPLIRPSPRERQGYVPNVVYSCGGLVHDRTLLLPFGVADSFTAFAEVSLDRLLAALR